MMYSMQQTCRMIVSSLDLTKDISVVSKLTMAIITTGLSLSITHCDILTGAHVLFLKHSLVITSVNLNDGWMSEHLCVLVVFVRVRSQCTPNVNISGQSKVKTSL